LRNSEFYKLLRTTYLRHKRLTKDLMGQLLTKSHCCHESGKGTCCPGEYLVWPGPEFSLPKLQYNVVSKRNSVISRYLDSKSREVSLALLMVSLIVLWWIKVEFSDKNSMFLRHVNDIPQFMRPVIAYMLPP